MTESADDFIAHFGIKGMRWGVRRPEGANGRVTGSVSAKPSREEVTIEVGRKGRQSYTGGIGIAAHPDAVKAKISKQKARASGVDALGNEELKNLIKRLNLEADYSRLNPREVSRGEKFTKELGKISANTARGIGQKEANRLGLKVNDVAQKAGTRFAKEAFSAYAQSKSRKKPKDGGTYTVVRKALGA